MSKRAEERAMEAYPEHFTQVWGPLPGGDILTVDDNTIPRKAYKQGYEQAEKDISALIESIIEGILGDAQPKPILRAELQELITKIKEAKK